MTTTREQRHAQKRHDYPLHTYIDGTLPTRQCDVIVCLTLYNEPAHALAESLAGLARNQRQLQRNGVRMQVCILLDGEKHLHESTATYLKTLGLEPWQGPPDTRDGPNRLYLRGCKASLQHWLPEAEQESLNLLLACKRDNGGKLDSHAWLFWGVCSQIDTRYVMQLDTGSIPEPGCVNALLEHMQREPQCAAVTTHIRINAPQDLDPAHNWQYGDYLWEKVSDWAVGNAFNYLEVVPGQCSLIDRARFCAQDDHARSALDDYLRGIEPQGLLERNLFLAEDRVLGFELVRRQSGGSIRYTPLAPLRTDMAPDFAELVRQRRRWINSTLAARCYSLLRLPSLLGDASLAPMRRLGVLFSLCWGWLNLFAQLSMPAFAALLVAIGISHGLPLAAETRHDAGLLTGALFIGGWAALALLSRNLALDSAHGVFWHKLAISLTGLVLLCGTTLSLLCASSTNLLTMSAALGLMMLAIILQSSSELRHILRWMLYYLLLLPTFSLYLTTFSIANLSDTSWGTKGLTQSSAQVDERRRWARWRDGLLLAWILLSGLAVGAFLLLVPSSAWITALQVTSSVFFLRVAIAALTSLAAQWHCRRAARRSTRMQVSTPIRQS